MTTLSAVKRWFTYAEAAAYCGLSRQTLARMVQCGRIRAHDPTGSGRPVLLDGAELDALIESSAAQDPLPAA